MTFNPGDGTGVVDEINDICQSDSNSYPLLSKARRVNAALDRFFTLAFRSDGRWSYDDYNHDNEPIMTMNISNGINKYALDTFTSEIIGVMRVEIRDSSGTDHTLTRIDKDAVESTALTNIYNASGTPTKYDLFGKYIYLYPTPDANVSNGLSLYVTRNKDAFTSASTTKTLPVPSLFNQYVCRLASLPYLIEFQKGQKNDIAAQITSDEQEILMHFKNRAKYKDTMTPFLEDNR